MIKKDEPLYYNLSEKHKCFTITFPHTGSRSFIRVLDYFDFDTYELKNNKLVYKKQGSQHNHTFDLFQGHENYKMMISSRNPYELFVSKFRFYLGGTGVMKSTFDLKNEFLNFLEEFLVEIDSSVWFKKSELMKIEELLKRPIDYRIRLEDLNESYSKIPFINNDEFNQNGTTIHNFKSQFSSLDSLIDTKIGDHKELRLIKPWVSHLPSDFKEFYNEKIANLIYENFSILFLFMDYDKDSWKKEL